MSPIQQKPIMHGRDHMPGGADPIPDWLAGGFSRYEDLILAEPDLWGYWPLNELSGYTFADAYGSHDLTGVDDPGNYEFDYGVTGVFTDETAIGFIGKDSGVAPNQGTSASVDLTTPEAAALFGGVNPFTIELWAFPFTPTVIDSVAEIDLWGYLATLGSGSDESWGLLLYEEVGLGPYLQFFRDGGAAISADPPTLDEWHHIAATYDGTTARLYLDGVEVGSDTATTITAEETFQIGRQTVTTGQSHYLEGRLAHVALYSAALSSGTILAHANAGSSGALGGPEAFQVLTADGAGGTSWEFVDTDSTADGAITTLKIEDEAVTPAKIEPGTNGYSLQTVAGAVVWAAGGGGASASDSYAWMPLHDDDGTLVLDGDGDLIPTFTPI